MWFNNLCFQFKLFQQITQTTGSTCNKNKQQQQPVTDRIRVYFRFSTLLPAKKVAYTSRWIGSASDMVFHCFMLYEQDNLTDRKFWVRWSIKAMSLRIVLVISSLKQKNFWETKLCCFCCIKAKWQLIAIYSLSAMHFCSEILYNFVYWTKVADILGKTS